MPRERGSRRFSLNTGGGPVEFAPPAGGDYNGIYVVEEKIKRDANRVNISSLDPAETAEPEITGGYLFKFDEPDPDEFTFDAGGIAAPGSSFIYEYPDGDEMVGALRLAQNQYLTNYLNALAAALHAPDWTNTVTGYARYLDVEAAIDHHLINVLGLNVDAFRLSSYLHKPRNAKLKLGPQWDFDRALGTSRGDDRAFNPRSWRGINYDFSTDFFNPSGYYNNAWYHRLFHDPDFWQRYIDRYQDLRSRLWTTNVLFAVVDGLAGQVRAAHGREVARWGGNGPSDTSPRSGVVSANGYTYDFGPAGSYQGGNRLSKDLACRSAGFHGHQFRGLAPTWNCEWVCDESVITCHQRTRNRRDGLLHIGWNRSPRTRRCGFIRRKDLCRGSCINQRCQIIGPRLGCRS